MTDQPKTPGTSEEIQPEEPERLLYRDLGTGPEGLAPREAARRLQQRGPNVIERREGESHLAELARQLTHPLALLLWVAAGLAVLGDLLPLAIAIVAVILMNAVFAFAQERQAEKATEALLEFLPPHATVRRGGEELAIDATEIVPGDVLLIEEGDRLSADVRLIAGSVEIDMSPLTGESQPVARSAERTRVADSPLESEDLGFSGCMCTAGTAEGIVYATGMHTQLGRIAALSQRVSVELSPLQVDVNRVATLIAAVAVIAGVVFFAIGSTIAGLPIDDAITFAIGLLVANVPEGLLPTITLALAVGVRRMARRKALVKRLTAVETLGSTDVICTDKTGTLTEGRMEVEELWADGATISPTEAAALRASEEPFSGLLRTAVRCNNAHTESAASGPTGDPGEQALLEAAAKLGEDVVAAQSERASRRQAAFPFEAHLKRMTTRDVEGTDQLWFHSKGAPLELLDRCASVRGPDGDRPITRGDRETARRAFEDYARRGLRVLGFAERRASAEEADDRDVAESGLTFLGLVAMQDPPRAEVFEAVAACREAGIRIIVVTGDTGLTAAAIAREVGIVRAEPRILTGTEIEALTEPQLDELLARDEELIVARSNPETKLHLVDALRHRGHTVAMTGDGVNDAPALRRADIGVAMGRSGTDVAREASTMVLTDDNFASIVAAVHEGRVVYENIRKFVTYIFAHATPEVIPFLIFALSGGSIPLPLTALQILAIDLGTETLPALALGREPAEPGIMQQRPRPRGEGIISRSMLTRAWLWLGMVEAALVTGGFFWVLTKAGWSPGDPTDLGSVLHQDYLAATTMTFAGITACQIGTAFAVRTARSSLRSIGVFSNRLLLWGIAFEIAVAAALIYLPPLQELFETAALGPAELAVLATFPFVVWGTDEARRAIARIRSTR